MTETQRRPVPRLTAGEVVTALAFLGFARECVVKKLEGLSEEQVRRELVPTGTNLLGLVQHLAASEHYWFAHHLAGEPLGAAEDDVYFSMAVPPDRPAAAVLADYRAVCSRSDAIVTGIGDPDALSARPVDGEPRPMRWVLAHMTSETARHAGHADILRELLDGTTGR